MESLIRFSKWARLVVSCGCLLATLAPGTSRLQAQLTAADGTIIGSGWLTLGPFNSTYACGGTQDDFFRNHIGPVHHIACEAPAEGDEILGYDPTDPAGGSTGYTGPTSDGGNPYWRPFDDGADDSTLNLDADLNLPVPGDQTNVMSWLVTYIEYTGPTPIFATICVGSDDGVQVWWDKSLVHNNASACRGWGYCQDSVPVLVTPGVHVIKMGIWEEGGGWGGLLGLVVDGQPVLDDAALWPDWTFLGREGTLNLAPCEPSDFDAYVPGVQGINCVRRPDGGRDLSWSNPPQADPGVAIKISVNGTQLGTVPGTATSFTVPAASVPPGLAFFCVENSGGIVRCTTCRATDDAGYILTGAFLALGPFSEPFGCNNNNNSILGNHIAPSHIRDQYPVLGDEVPYDATLAVTNSYHPSAPTAPSGNPIWRPFDDGSDNGDQDMEADLVGSLDDHMTWLLTYVEYLGDAPVDVELCIGSDDGVQAWDNCDVIHNNNACRGRALCQDVVMHTITPGVHALRIAAWERGGGWGCSLGLREPGTLLPITDDETLWPDWRFHGRQRPAGFVAPECGLCAPEPVQITSCEFGRVGLGTGVIVRWINPPTIDPLVQTIINVNGAQVATVASDATTVSIPAGALPAGALLTIEVVHCGGIGATCSPNKTDATGNINSTRWMVLGPFQNPFGCNGNNDSILGNHIAPSFIGCEYPSSADTPDNDANEVAYDLADPAQVSTGYVGPMNANSLPYWRPFNDGSDDGDQNLDADVGGDLSTVVSWMATYIEIVGAPLEIEFCGGSDDGFQVWANSTLLHNNNACRGRAFCQDRFRATLDVGVHCIRAAAWENGGGWGLSLSMNDGLTGLPIVDDGSFPEVIFHGTTRPVAGNTLPCELPTQAVENLVCGRNQAGGLVVSWTNVPQDPAPAEINITLNGDPVGTVAGNATSFVLPGPLPEGALKVCVDNGSVRPVCCGVMNGDELYINCGGPEFTDLLGRVWTEDSLVNPSAFLSGPNVYTADWGNPLGVNITADPLVVSEEYPAEIFPFERWNDGPIEYTVNGLPAGNYDVTLLFMEGCCSDGCEDIADPATSAGGCRVFDLYINGTIVQDQFSQNVLASQVSGNVPGVASNFVAVALSYPTSVAGPLVIRVEDLGGGNPPENASIKGICIKPSGGVVEQFHRADSNNDGKHNISDPVNTLNVLFLGSGSIPCQDAADSNDDGKVNISDPVNSLNVLFLGTGAIPPPAVPDLGPCGPDPTADSPSELGCETYSHCA
jgi:hypothetical protein